MNETVLSISGMRCGGCVSSVEAVLTALPGVNQVAVDLAAGTARIRFDATRITVDAIAQAVNAAGFTTLPP